MKRRTRAKHDLLFYSAFACVLLSGCVQLQQVHFLENPHDIRISAGYGQPLGVSIRTPTLDREKQGGINSRLSHATDAHGKRYSVLAKPNEFAQNYPERSYFTSDELYLVNPSNEAQTLKDWPNGNWDLHLVFDSSRKRKALDASFRLSNFTFILFAHRPN